MISLVRTVCDVADTASHARDTSALGNSRTRDPAWRSGIKSVPPSVVETRSSTPRLSAEMPPFESLKSRSMSVFIRLWSINPSSASSHGCSKSLSARPSQPCFSIMNFASEPVVHFPTGWRNTLVPNIPTLTHQYHVSRLNTSPISLRTRDSANSADRSIHRH